MKHYTGSGRSGDHSTLIDLVSHVIGAIRNLNGISGISPGYIQTSKGVAGGTHKVKIGNSVGSILLTVRQSISVQEIRVYACDLRAAKLAIAKALRDNHIAISFHHE